MRPARTEAPDRAHLHIAIALVAGLAGFEPSVVQAQEQEDAPEEAGEETVDIETLPSTERETAPDFGYSRALRLERIGSAMMPLALGGVFVGGGLLGATVAGLWVVVVSSIVGVHGFVLFAIAAGVRARADARAEEANERLRIGFDVRAGPNEAGLVLNGSF